MSGRILIVDDNPINLRLLEVRLAAEYFETVQATNGFEALEICRLEPLDLVLTDVMMPRMDGFELCRRIKADPALMHLPVVMITALDQPTDRMTGLEAGADDFLSKPVRDLPLFSRVRSLTRIKQMTDELRRRAETAAELLIEGEEEEGTITPLHRIAVVSERQDEARRIADHLGQSAATRIHTAFDAAFAAISGDPVSLIVVDLAHRTQGDPMRFLARVRASEVLRHLPVVAVTAPDDEAMAARALELGAHDYLQRPVDRNELLARVRTQLARHRYGERLRNSVERTLELAVIDGLTGLHNRRFLDAHLKRAIATAGARDGRFAVVLADLDHFKRVNDRHGHGVGDMVLREFARRIETSIRASDLACRIGGEEFAILLPNADEATAEATAERLRTAVCGTPFLGEDQLSLSITLSAGVATFPGHGADPAALLKAADAALYAAKRGGRNRVGIAA